MKKNTEKTARTAFNDALKILARKDVSSRKLALALSEKGWELDDIESAVSQLGAKGLVDDEKLKGRMSELYLEKGKGYFYVKYHLNQQGLDASPPFTAEEEAKAALKVIKQKKITKADLRDPKKKIRLLVFLSRRGFRQDAITRALAAFLGK